MDACRVLPACAAWPYRTARWPASVVGVYAGGPCCCSTAASYCAPISPAIVTMGSGEGHNLLMTVLVTQCCI